MKKLLIIIASVLIAQSLSAQIIVGGNIGITSGANGNGIGVNIAPEIGYNVLPNLALGSYFSYQSRYNSFGVTPYVRWHFVSLGNRVRLFLATTVPMRFREGYQSYGVNVRPGITISLADRIALQAHIGTFGYCYEKSGLDVSSYWLARVNGDNISIGFCIGI